MHKLLVGIVMAVRGCLRGPVLFGGCSEDLSPPVVLHISRLTLAV